MFKKQQFNGPPFTFYTSGWRMLPSFLFNMVCTIYLGSSIWRTVVRGKSLIRLDSGWHVAITFIDLVVFPWLVYFWTRTALDMFSTKPILTIDERGWSTLKDVKIRVNWDQIERISTHGKGQTLVIGVIPKNKQYKFILLGKGEDLAERRKKKAQRVVRTHLTAFKLVGACYGRFLPMKKEDFFALVGPYTAEMIAKNAHPDQDGVAAYPRQILGTTV